MSTTDETAKKAWTDYEALIAELRGIKNDGLHYKAADAVEALQAENEKLREQLDSMTVEWGVALPGESGFETPDRVTAESFVRDYPDEEYSLVQHLVGPWTVVPEDTK